MSQYIGKTISLISNKGVRYVGLLENINAEDATVALKSVRSFGTEGRMAQVGNPASEVMPGKDIYGYVVFRGSDVKDLTVLDLPIDQVQPEPYYPPPSAGYYGQQPPPQTGVPNFAPSVPQFSPGQPSTAGPTGTINASSPISSSPRPAPRPNPPYPSEPVHLPSQTNGLAGNGPYEEPIQTPSPSQTVQKDKPTATQSQLASQAGNEPQSTLQNKASQTGIQGSVPGPSVTAGSSKTANNDFDFSAANEEFEKERQAQAKENKAYNKSSSFFDTISSSTRSKNTMKWSEEKELNLDTFGESSVGHNGRGRGGRGRGRGRGGRGRGGRGRGNSRGGRKEPTPEWA